MSKEIIKGSILFIDGWWFVVVKQKGESLYCICDNANNRYFMEAEDAKLILSPREAMRLESWGSGTNEAIEARNKREIPVEVIAEVLSGCHDDRFNDC